MILIDKFITQFSGYFPKQNSLFPWEITQDLNGILIELISQLDINYDIDKGIAIHKTAAIENGVVLKAPLIVGENCYIGPNACLRGGVYLSGLVKVGAGCEIKTSIIFGNSAIAHFNFIGDSIIGGCVNFEAGSVTANHFNERKDKNISVLYNTTVIPTGISKFGSLIGDNSKIGANAVLSPGTILPPGSIVKRLELIDQLAGINV